MMKLMKTLATGLFLGLVSTAASAVPMNFVEGTHYFPTTEKLATPDDNKIEVVEMFSYTCPHCFKLEPEVDAWKKTLPENVHFVKVPAIFRDSWLELAKVYYAAEAMGNLDKIHSKLFNAIHVEKRRLTSEDQLLDFVAEQGIDREEFKKTMNSFSVKAKVKKALVMSQTSGITGVPSFIVNGAYRTDASTAGGVPELFNVVNFLIEKSSEK
ncbi:MAG TPA: thiol:disulfide interchange protein DsbA/DsbL [Methylophaga aminisulfidivorans]|jgi:thiol:disulfide interchange protein DsbA|uniref:Thiol:disulfide interchange protein n=2 Tax=Methylophaga TaxID=40222 RepID=F5T2A5_9GAMM|nr:MULTISPECIES: thiol:disulfide interchange protein DsbA/DsbL [Methylophaga]EGL53700.1 putative dithiol-disulfide isomerase involved in polyketide biosynthesis [Methylophaga aminisulfidivorans MP]WVI85077.1 thiol:disulfide interchange protein DsbA/DsbL [Methylophaga thalassica]GLQ00187.1 thiol:disulfide interchange protein DsbA [Methylophaga thalassica]HIC46444.1 thiol:disulfide interchange protein DsbA/DsbL [Methylophaga sp.]HIM38569.1 thiol:disulfide interchange protein DsbA/DsbL [Methyloph